MRAVLIGSAVYRDVYTDIDLIADQEFAETCLSKYSRATADVEGVRGNSYVVSYSDKIIEIFVPKPGTAHDFILQKSYVKTKNLLDFQVLVPELPILAALKKAHLIAHHKWERNIREYGKIKELLGVKTFEPSDYGPEVSQLFKLHREEIKKEVKKHPKLKTGKDQFFEEAEFKIFDHDSIHRAIALGSVPAYTLMLDGEVWCSRKKWDALSEEDKLRCVVEESAILALERSIIPSLYLDCQFRGAQWAYEYALSKVCTSITSGFFREYAIEHWEQAVKLRPDYVSKFFEGFKNEKIIVLKPEIVLGKVLSV